MRDDRTADQSGMKFHTLRRDAPEICSFVETSCCVVLCDSRVGAQRASPAQLSVGALRSNNQRRGLIVLDPPFERGDHVEARGLSVEMAIREGSARSVFRYCSKRVATCRRRFAQGGVDTHGTPVAASPTTRPGNGIHTENPVRPRL